MTSAAPTRAAGLSMMALPYYEMGAAAMLAAINPEAHPTGIVRVPGRFVDRTSFFDKVRKILVRYHARNGRSPQDS